MDLSSEKKKVEGNQLPIAVTLLFSPKLFYIIVSNTYSLFRYITKIIFEKDLKKHKKVSLIELQFLNIWKYFFFFRIKWCKNRIYATFKNNVWAKK